MSSTCSARLRELNEHIGSGKIKARVTIDQLYAQDQHENMMYKHTRGGGPKFLERALFEDAPEHYQSIANDILDVEKSMVRTMADVGHGLIRGAARRSPIFLGDLSRSGALAVLEGSRIVLREAPQVDRLTEAELEAKGDLRHDMGIDPW